MKYMGSKVVDTGMDSLGDAVQHWQEAIHLTPQGNNTETDDAVQRSNAELTFRLERLLHSAYGVQSECERTLSMQSLASSSETVTITLSGSERTLTGDFSDDDSFVSASELAELDDITELKLPQSRALYIDAMNAVSEDLVHCRKYRTNLLHCKNDIDFLAKLHCVRQAFDVLFEQDDKVDWFIDLGKNTMGDLVFAITQDTEEYCSAYFNVIDYVRDEDNWGVVMEELTSRKVQCLNFYDVVLDFTLMDAFDDMDKLPASVAAIAQNRWLSNSVKHTAMSNAIWSLIALKRKMLSNSDGFLSRFYTLSASMSPALCWGFLGPNEELRNVCYYFKDQVIKVLRNMFDLSVCRYSTKEELAEDILATIRDNAMHVEAELSKAMQTLN